MVQMIFTKQIDRRREQTVDTRGKEGRWDELGGGIDTYTLLCIQLMTDENPLGNKGTLLRALR